MTYLEKKYEPVNWFRHWKPWIMASRFYINDYIKKYPNINLKAQLQKYFNKIF